MDGKERLEKARERIIESIAQNIHLYGLTPSAGRQYGTMFFHNEPLTLDDMTEKLGMSKTSMSTSVRALSDLKLVERAWKRGVRKDLISSNRRLVSKFYRSVFNQMEKIRLITFSRSEKIIGGTRRIGKRSRNK